MLHLLLDIFNIFCVILGFGISNKGGCGILYASLHLYFLPQGAQIHQKPHPISTKWYFCKITLFFLFNEIIIVFLQKIKKNEKK